MEKRRQGMQAFPDLFIPTTLRRSAVRNNGRKGSANVGKKRANGNQRAQDEVLLSSGIHIVSLAEPFRRVGQKMDKWNEGAAICRN